MRRFRYAEDGFFEKDVAFDAMVIDSVEDYLEKRKRLDEYIGQFAAEIRREDLKRALRYRNIKGQESERSFGGLVLHMFNHQTHHRGMISVYLDEMKISNDFSNLANMV